MNARHRLVAFGALLAIAGAGLYAASELAEVAVKDDPLVRMPGTQPGQGVTLEGPHRCLNCHGGYNQAVEPGFNWKGSMMAQAARDPIFWACMVTAAQDAKWATGSTNVTDLCLRCHFPEGWLAGRSDPTNATAMIGSDYDGLHCDFCHRMYDPFAPTTASGEREGNDWTGYWDEAGSLSQSEADKTLAEDLLQIAGIKLLSGGDFFVDAAPAYATYDDNVSGQYFVSAGGAKRSSFADAAAKHKMLYSRYHKSRHFCATCHDVSNPVLANLTLPLPDQSGGVDQISEQYTASQYFHVERTYSEFRLSAYARGDGAETNADFQAQGAPGITKAAMCQDCHMRDVTGLGCNKKGSPIRPDGSSEHPNSGMPLHDMTGGNLWISHILASLDPDGPVPDQRNVEILAKGPDVLTLDLTLGETPAINGAALKAGADRAKQQLRLAATIKNLTYDAGSGKISFRVQNNTGHKLISGFPEGRRMFVNIQAYKSGVLLGEVNPYDYDAGTLKGLGTGASPALGTGEAYEDELVYEVHPRSDLTGEDKTFHFVLATGRSKDNRIPPKGFDIDGAAERMVEPVHHGVIDPEYFTPEEYAGGYDEVDEDIAPGADRVVVTLYYQGTSREYIEFLRDEINGTGGTLPAEAYIVQTDPFFAKLKEWGNMIWDLWEHNHGLDGSGVMVEGIVPVEMAKAEVGDGAPPPPELPVPTLAAPTPGNAQVTLTWSDEHTTDTNVVGYAVYYDQDGKSQLIETVGKTTTYTDTALTNGQEYCYKVTSLYAEAESAFSNVVCGIPNNQGQARLTVDSVLTGRYEKTGKGKNQTVTFVEATRFTRGDGVIVRVRVLDASTSLPLSGATVEVAITGPESAAPGAVTTDGDGIAEVEWKTSAPKRGKPGTPIGTYTATVTSVTATGYTWDGTAPSATFTLE